MFCFNRTPSSGLQSQRRQRTRALPAPDSRLRAMFASDLCRSAVAQLPLTPPYVYFDVRFIMPRHPSGTGFHIYVLQRGRQKLRRLAVGNECAGFGEEFFAASKSRAKYFARASWNSSVSSIRFGCTSFVNPKTLYSCTGRLFPNVRRRTGGPADALRRTVSCRAAFIFRLCMSKNTFIFTA